MKIRRGFVPIIVQILIKQKYFQHCDLNNTIYDLHSIECNKSSARSSGKEKTQSCSQINIKHAEDEKQGNNGWRGGRGGDCGGGGGGSAEDELPGALRNQPSKSLIF